ncbi:MAG: mobile mystery protein B [Bacteroidota bacterium]
MGLTLQYGEGQTPLDIDEKEGLLISTIATRGELDEFEQQNIEDAIQWVMSRRFTASQVFSEDFVKALHKRMYGKVWRWAGSFRLTNKNLGTDKWQIAIDLRQLLDDCLYWHENGAVAGDELAIRFKHRIVSIHCFPNGDGRHSRLMADIIAEKILGLPVYTWGAGDLVADSETRAAYLRAVRAADRGDYGPLLIFARS